MSYFLSDHLNRRSSCVFSAVWSSYAEFSWSSLLQQTASTLITLRRCAAWSESSLFANGVKPLSQMAMIRWLLISPSHNCDSSYLHRKHLTLWKFTLWHDAYKNIWFIDKCLINRSEACNLIYPLCINMDILLDMMNLPGTILRFMMPNIKNKVLHTHTQK